MGAGDELKRQDNLAETTSDLPDDADTFKTWSDSYRKGNIVDLYLNKSGYGRAQQETKPDDSQSSKGWQKWFDSDEQSHTTKPVRFKSEAELKKEQTQEREIKTRVGVQEEEALAVKAWLDWYESGDSDLPSTRPITPPPDVQANELKTRVGVREEEALAVKSWLDWYEAGDNPANQIPVEQTTPKSSELLEKELKTRIGVREEEAKAVKAWTDFYNAGDFLDAYLEKSGY